MSGQPAPAAPGRVQRLASAVRLLILDVDGVLTDGRLYYGADGVRLTAFHARDGSAIKRLLAAGVPVAAISGRASPGAARRLAELGVRHVYAGVEDKGEALDRLCAATGVAAEHMAHIGDDVPDLPLFERVGLAIAVPEAHPCVLARAHWVTTSRGGRGAVQEVCDLVLTARRLWPDTGAGR